jgi:hypothetical protein
MAEVIDQIPYGYVTSPVIIGDVIHQITGTACERDRAAKVEFMIGTLDGRTMSRRQPLTNTCECNDRAI